MIAQREQFLALFLLFWFLLIFYITNVDTFVLRYLDLVIIPVYILASYMFSRLYIKNRIIISAVVMYFVISMFIFMYPMLSFRHYYNGEKRFALFVKEKTEKNAVIIALDDAPFISYYAKRMVVSYDFSDLGKIDKFLIRIQQYLKEGIPVYLSETALSSYLSEYFDNVLLNNYKVTILGSCLWEDYHSAEDGFALSYPKLLRLQLKG